MISQKNAAEKPNKRSEVALRGVIDLWATSPSMGSLKPIISDGDQGTTTIMTTSTTELPRTQQDSAWKDILDVYFHEFMLFFVRIGRGRSIGKQATLS